MLLGELSTKVAVSTIREAQGLEDLIAEGVVNDVRNKALPGALCPSNADFYSCFTVFQFALRCSHHWTSFQQRSVRAFSWTTSITYRFYLGSFDASRMSGNRGLFL